MIWFFLIFLGLRIRVIRVDIFIFYCKVFNKKFVYDFELIYVYNKDKINNDEY